MKEGNHRTPENTWRTRRKCPLQFRSRVACEQAPRWLAPLRFPFSSPYAPLWEPVHRLTPRDRVRMRSRLASLEERALGNKIFLTCDVESGILALSFLCSPYKRSQNQSTRMRIDENAVAIVFVVCGSYSWPCVIVQPVCSMSYAISGRLRRAGCKNLCVTNVIANYFNILG